MKTGLGNVLRVGLPHLCGRDGVDVRRRQHFEEVKEGPVWENML